MATVWFSYQFDSIKFYNKMLPLIPELETGNYQTLYQIAQQNVENRPESWSLLDDLFLGPPFAEEDEEPSPRRLLMMVLVQYLKRIPEYSMSKGWQFLRRILPLIDWNEQDIQLLLFGKSLCTLLIPEKSYHLKESGSNPQDLPWCMGYVSWLDINTIERLRRQLIQSQKAYLNLIEQYYTKQSILPEIAINVSKLQLDRYPYEMTKTFLKDLIRILTVAAEAESSIAIAIA